MFSVDLAETGSLWPYQQIAPIALHLRQLGLNNLQIAKHLDVDDKTIAKALAWIERLRPESH